MIYRLYQWHRQFKKQQQEERRGEREIIPRAFVITFNELSRGDVSIRNYLKNKNYPEYSQVNDII